MNDAGDVLQWVLTAWLGLVSTVMGAFYHSHDRLREKQAAFETRVAEMHPTKAEMARIDEKLDRILEKLDEKADKSPVR